MPPNFVCYDNSKLILYISLFRVRGDFTRSRRGKDPGTSAAQRCPGDYS